MGNVGMIQRKMRSDVTDEYTNYHLRNARIAAGFTMRQLASAVGVGVPLINSYERMRNSPNPFIARRLSYALHKKIHQLFPKEIRPYYHEIAVEREERHDGNSAERAIERAQLSASSPHEYLRLERMKSALHPRHLSMVSLQRLVAEEDPSETAEQSEISERVVRAFLDTLSFREREVLILRYGLSPASSGCTLEDVGRIFNVTKERVRQIEAKAIAKLAYRRRSQLINEGVMKELEACF